MDGQKGKKNENVIYLVFSPNSPKQSQWMYISAYEHTVPVIFSVLVHSTFTVQIYSLQLNCTYSNYTEVAATCSAAQ